MEAWRRSSRECADQVVRAIEKKDDGVRAVALKLARSDVKGNGEI
jgi:hypothetical protein